MGLTSWRRTRARERARSRNRRPRRRRPIARDATPLPTSLQDPLIRGDISHVAVLILDAAGATVERFVAALALRPEILASVDAADVEGALRSALLKLACVDAALAPLPPHCTFEVTAAASGRGCLPAEEWADGGERPRRAGAGAAPPPPPGVLPLKSAAAGGGALKLSLYVEAAC